MEHYQDIKILPDPEFPVNVLMNALFSKLHRALVRLGSNEIGVSFPKVNNDKPTLGNVLRLHGSADALQGLQQENWLVGMRDHTDLSEIAPVPEHARYCRVKRVQAKSSADRLRRRYCKRHEGVTLQDAETLIPNSVEEHLNLPYLQLISESTKQRFRLFIEHETDLSNRIVGEFNTYGLSRNATVPWF